MGLNETAGGIKRVCPLVLAGGQSSRMGQDKALLKLPCGQTMLERAKQLLDALQAPPGIELLPTLISGARPGGIPDRYPAAGPLGGLQAVAAHLQEQAAVCDALLVVPVDMPLLQPGQLKTLCSAGQCVEQAVCFDSHFLPCWLPLNPRCRNYLDAAARGDSIPSVRALFGYLGCVQLPAPAGHWHLNANRPEEFAQIAALATRS